MGWLKLVRNWVVVLHPAILAEWGWPFLGLGCERQTLR